MSIFNSKLYLILQIVIALIYLVVVFVGCFSHEANYRNVITGAQSGTVSVELLTPDTAGVEDRMWLINLMELVEIILLVIILVDVFIKIINHIVVKKQLQLSQDELSGNNTGEMSSEAQIEGDAVEHFGGMALIMDISLTIFIYIIYGVEMYLKSNGELNYILIGMLMVRAYMKIPFACALCIHH